MGVANGRDKVGSRDIEESVLGPLAGREGEDRVDTCRLDCIPFADDRYIEVGHTMLEEVRKVMHKRTKGKRPESYENSLRC